MKEILDLQLWPSNSDELNNSYEDYDIKDLENKATFLHNAINTANSVRRFFYLETLITGNKKEGYRLDVKIIKGINEEYKHKENTHKQKTDI